MYSYAAYVPVDAASGEADHDAMELARAMGSAVAAARMTQEALEKATGIDQGRISKLLRGVDNRRPTLDELRRIEAACNYPYGYILGLAGLITVDGVRRGVEAAAKTARAR